MECLGSGTDLINSCRDGRADGSPVLFGNAGDIPIAGDFDRDGESDDVGYYRTSTSEWRYDHDHDGSPDGPPVTWGSTGQPLHTNFKLKAAGEYLGLIAPNLSVVSEFAPQYPPQYPDVSYGADNRGLGYFPTPTPGSANGSTRPVIGRIAHTPIAPKNTDPVVVTAEVIHDPKTSPTSVGVSPRP